MVRSALSEVHDATELRIRANPDDVPLLEPRWQEMLPRSVAEHSELIADDLVERGGVIVETRIGYADSQLKTRMNQVVTTFQAVLDGEPVMIAAPRRSTSAATTHALRGSLGAAVPGPRRPGDRPLDRG